MKHLILISLLVISLSAFSQNHMSFLGVPINGTISNCTNSLKNKGFKLVKLTDTSALMSGMYSLKGDTPEKVYLLVFSNSKNKLVYSIAVWFKRDDLRSYFFMFKEKLNKIYGLYDFDSGLFNTDDSDYLTIWKDKLGEIRLHVDLNYNVISVTYQDKINGEIWEKDNNINAAP